MEIKCKNRSKKCFLKMILCFVQRPWKITAKKIFLSKSVNCKIVISRKTCSSLVFLKYCHQIFLYRQHNLFGMNNQDYKNASALSDCINTNNTYFQICFEAVFIKMLWACQNVFLRKITSSFSFGQPLFPWY